MYFDELDLNDNVLDALYDMHFDKCTPVQENCIPEILKGNDVLGVAQTGTGKTAAYLLPVLSKLDDGGYPDKAINCLIMSPTRELAQQIDQAMQGFSYYLQGVSSVAVYGGNDGNRYDQELKSLQLGADVVIATPGRLISHISLGNVDLSKVSFFILDEADRMLDMGFADDIKTIAKKLPESCQTIMFSATMPKKIEEFANTLLKNPTTIKLAVSKPAEKILQRAYVCYELQKMGIIKDIFKAGDLQRVIIFCGSKLKVKQVAGALQRMNINCGEMHSDLDQAQRDDVMFKFKSGQLDVLVATDIVSRGIDIDDIAMVINYDVPHDAEDYVHRIGRTARAAREGVAYTFVSEEDMYYFQQIEKFLEKEVEKVALPEGLGEVPEYKEQKRPMKPQKGGKTNAKDRRRQDRDHNSHKDKKQENRRKNNNERKQQEQNGENAKKPRNNKPQNGQQAEADGQRSNNSQRNNNRRRNNKPVGEGEQMRFEHKPKNGEQNRNEQYAQQPQGEGKKRNNNNRRRNNKPVGEGEQMRFEHKPKNGEQNAQQNENGQQPRNKQRRRGNVEGNYKKRNPQTQRNDNHQNKPATQPAAPVKKESAVKKFFKKIFGFKK